MRFGACREEVITSYELLSSVDPVPMRFLVLERSASAAPGAPTSQCKSRAEHDAEGGVDEADHLKAHRAHGGHQPGALEELVCVSGDGDLDNAVVGKPSEDRRLRAHWVVRKSCQRRVARVVLGGRSEAH